MEGKNVPGKENRKFRKTKGTRTRGSVDLWFFVKRDELMK